MVQVGSVRFSSNVLLAPIAGYSDLPYRLIVRPLGGLGMAYTELVNPVALLRETKRSLQLVESAAEDRPLGIQLYGWDAAELAEGARWAAERGSTVVDLNYGCPVPKVAGKGGGSGLLRCCPNAIAIADACVRASPVPVTVKTRLGWEMGNLIAPELAKRLRDVGVAALTIHGRYGEQKFAGSIDPDGIARVVEAVPEIPVFGNGDIKTVDDAVRLVERTGCAGVMIGRRALADPWFCRDVAARLAGRPTPEPPSRIERVEKIIEHFALMRKHQGDHHAVIDFRKRMPWYCKTVGPCPDLRRNMPRMQSVAEFHDRIGAFLDEIRSGRAIPWNHARVERDELVAA